MLFVVFYKCNSERIVFGYLVYCIIVLLTDHMTTISARVLVTMQIKELLKCPLPESNQQPIDYKSIALPVELRRQWHKVCIKRSSK